MNNTCPECGAVYTVAQKDVGRRIACKKCRTPLLVTERGLERDDVVTAEIDDSTELRRPPREPGAGFFERLRNLADVPTYLFGAGAFVTIYFLFAPLIDLAKVERRDADLVEADLVRNRHLREAKGEDAKKKINDDWKAESERLGERVSQAKIDARQGLYWNRYGMLFGCLLLALASLGYLSPQQPPIRRVVGAIILCGILILILLVFFFLFPK